MVVARSTAGEAADSDLPRPSRLLAGPFSLATLGYATLLDPS